MTLLDTSGMFDAAAALPEQLAVAARSASEVGGLPPGDAIANVVLFGMGGSGLAGDVMTVVAGPFMPVPVVVHKGYGIPNFIGSDTHLQPSDFCALTRARCRRLASKNGAIPPQRVPP